MGGDTKNQNKKAKRPSDDTAQAATGQTSVTVERILADDS